MEQLYPLNILERHYPVLRERREKEEREQVEEEAANKALELSFEEHHEVALHENEPLESGSVGRSLNTVA